MALTNCSSSERTLIELKIAGSYVKLSSIPEDSPEASVLLASIGSCEIRMFRDAEVHLEIAPLFWLELSDLNTKTSVDRFICHILKDAVAVFDDFVLQAANLNKLDGPDNR